MLRRIAAPERAPRAYARAALALNYDPERSAGDAEDVPAVERDLRLLAPQYPRITQPLIAVHGDEDRVLWPQQSERLVDAVPGAELRLIAGAGHLLPVTRAAELAAAVDDVAVRVHGHAGREPRSARGRTHVRRGRRVGARRRLSRATPGPLSGVSSKART